MSIVSGDAHKFVWAIETSKLYPIIIQVEVVSCAGTHTKSSLLQKKRQASCSLEVKSSPYLSGGGCESGGRSSKGEESEGLHVVCLLVVVTKQFEIWQCCMNLSLPLHTSTTSAFEKKKDEGWENASFIALLAPWRSLRIFWCSNINNQRYDNKDSIWSWM
jgi:hypothetical protein